MDVDVAAADLTFDGQTDMYTFRYEGMDEDDLVKIRFQCSSTSGCQGAGLGGIMVSDISTCSVAPDPDPDPSDPHDGGVPDPTTDAGGSNSEIGRGGGCQATTGGAGPTLLLILGLGLGFARNRLCRRSSCR